MASSSLDQLLEKLGKMNYFEKGYIRSNSNSDQSINDPNLNRIIAQQIWRVLKEYDSQFVTIFIETFKNGGVQSGPIERLSRFPGYRREFLEAKTNLMDANAVFASLKNNVAYHAVIPSKVYYRVIKPGYEKPKNQGPLVSLSYSIFSPSGLCLATAETSFINLQNTISGFSMGVRGMELGEVREIFIHPASAYGVSTSIDKAIYLKAIVKLINVEDDKEFSVKLDDVDLSFLLNDKSLEDIEKITRTH